MACNIKIEEWTDSEHLLLLQGWAREGLTNEQIAQKIGITDRTLYRWLKKDGQLVQALKKGKEVVDYAVENALLKNALNGDTTAQIYWLKNRRPDKWRDKPNTQTSDTIQDDPLTAAIFEEVSNGTIR